LDRIAVDSELVRVHCAAREKQRVVILDGCVCHLAIHGEPVRRLDVAVHCLDLAFVQGDQFGISAGSGDRGARLL
jgi:hypothetical protein